MMPVGNGGRVGLALGVVGGSVLSLSCSLLFRPADDVLLPEGSDAGIDSSALYPTTCTEALAPEPASTVVKIVTIDPDGLAGLGKPFPVTCIRYPESQPEVWTLVLKVDGRKADSRFFYDDVFWTNANPYRASELGIGNSAEDLQEAKFPSYFTVPVAKLLVVVRDAEGTTRNLVVPVHNPSGTNLRELIIEGQAFPSVSPQQWLGLFPLAVVQAYCRDGGLSRKGIRGSKARVRIGLIANNDDTECESHDSYVGLGGYVDTTACTPSLKDAGRNNGYSAGFVGGGQCGDGTNNVAAGFFAYVFVREPDSDGGTAP